MPRLCRSEEFRHFFWRCGGIRGTKVLSLAGIVQFLVKKCNAIVFLSDLVPEFSILALKDLEHRLSRFDLCLPHLKLIEQIVLFRR
jgi:hypothetical protein